MWLRMVAQGEHMINKCLATRWFNGFYAVTVFQQWSMNTWVHHGCIDECIRFHEWAVLKKLSVQLSGDLRGSHGYWWPHVTATLTDLHCPGARLRCAPGEAAHSTLSRGAEVQTHRGKAAAGLLGGEPMWCPALWKVGPSLVKWEKNSHETQCLTVREWFSVRGWVFSLWMWAFAGDQHRSFSMVKFWGISRRKLLTSLI